MPFSFKKPADFTGGAGERRANSAIALHMAELLPEFVRCWYGPLKKYLEHDLVTGDGRKSFPEPSKVRDDSASFFTTETVNPGVEFVSIYLEDYDTSATCLWTSSAFASGEK